ncbi:MAG: Nramp family divalent metal transporter [Acidobacteria bacterium]|nr:Nramp family divalent metal transporter [Acidobacteriota bacterium]MBV9474496.1 Nramp family divalent metal transporter [Acidobacteriota bacterium]
MKNVLKIALGILTSIGGFLDAGAIATSSEAGARYGFRLLWSLAFGTLCVVFLVEMAGRLAAVSNHTVADAMRERFGWRFFVFPLTAELIVDLFVIASEIGGVCLALQFVTGIAFRWWAFPVALLIWLFIWSGSFSFVEDSTAILGLVTIVFVVAVVKLHPDYHAIGAGFIPSMPPKDAPSYWFLAVSIIGAVISPYLLYFYSSGAVEDKWTEKDLNVNRGVSVIGMGFGSLVAMAVLVVAAQTLLPAGIGSDRYEQTPLMLSMVLGKTGFYLFAASVGIACFGAAVEASLSVAYLTAQSFGWTWGEDLPPKDDARFAMVYTVFPILAAAVTFSGIDPLKLTLFSMALTVVILPILLLPMIVLMNDEKFLKSHRNGWLSNAVGVVVVVVAIVLSVVAIPLELIGG